MRHPDEPIAISSPNYPENYPNNERMEVVIFVYRLNIHVELNFLDLELESSFLLIHGGKSYYTVSTMIKLSEFELHTYKQ